MRIKRPFFSAACFLAFLAVIVATVLPTFVRVSYRMATFDPQNATYPLSDCARLGTPPMVTLRHGKYATPGANPAEPFNIEISLQRVLHVVRGDTKIEIAELSCAPWGANYALQEWFFVGKNGYMFDRLDEQRLNSDYADAYPGEGNIWAGTEDVRIEKNQVLVVTALAGGSHASSKWSATLRYRLNTDNRLELLGAVTRTALPTRIM
ncbi:hypothetical protein [Burkholderia cenocepacia]|uniref:hypothetical protein n=1 Tax=Burkholderia cenocepacia TaxID=95486 RepID=UPI001BAB0F53|nr:hypothetical protein [Burkholderia cenocepacia]QUN38665.1 hypothetical protein KEH56_10630 [Burkholderia cenocepacia]QUO29431.1 hypothetical protein KEH57_23380 [Burkholderia cenocepacia]